MQLGYVVIYVLVPNAFLEKAGYGVVKVPPSMCFYTAELESEHERLSAAGVTVSCINDHFGTTTFAFSDPEDRWFAMMAKP